MRFLTVVGILVVFRLRGVLDEGDSSRHTDKHNAQYKERSHRFIWLTKVAKKRDPAILKRRTVFQDEDAPVWTEADDSE